MVHCVLVLVNFMKSNNLAINIFFAIAIPAVSFAIALTSILVGKLKPQEKQAIPAERFAIAKFKPIVLLILLLERAIPAERFAIAKFKLHNIAHPTSGKGDSCGALRYR
jgi:hypothetical protein